ncbi:hypothetical protein K502DRAFT_334185 [Neoconidiobolus thromboides FSU 785]|nr:hypothetical protein K502DRAFT_334185 [Neoconidiobolus thromboides FSU 785]
MVNENSTIKYDFRKDTIDPDLKISLKSDLTIRPHQQKSLSKMSENGQNDFLFAKFINAFRNPGIAAETTMKKSAFEYGESITVITVEKIGTFSMGAGIIISTYSMILNTTNRSDDTKRVMGTLIGCRWRLLLLDEAHIIPIIISAHYLFDFLILAILVRRNGKIKNSYTSIQSKLYEANWVDLSEKRYIAPLFRKFNLFFIMNCNKSRTCQLLVDYYKKRGDKIIIFCDNARIIKIFKRDPKIATILSSQVSDTSIGLSEAICPIQISSYYEFRLRISRAKRYDEEGFDGFFYFLVYKDTQEMYYPKKGQQFLVDQEYLFEVIAHLNGGENFSDFFLRLKKS